LNQFDRKLLVVVTGDITAAGERPSYEAAATWLWGRTYMRGMPGFGLDLYHRGIEVFAVPGNHDIWLKKSSRTLFHQFFSHDIPGAFPLHLGGTPVVIYTLDSNRLQRSDPYNFLNLRNVLGAGRIGRDQLCELMSLHHYLAMGNSKGLGSDFDFRGSLKIALMHHHLALPGSKPEGLEERLSILIDAKRVQSCLSEIGVHLVLCGHQHYPYSISLEEKRSERGPIMLSCAGTSSQVDALKNSFCVYYINRIADGDYSIKRLVYEASGIEHQFVFQVTPSE